MFDTFIKATRHSSTLVKTSLPNLQVFNLLRTIMLLEMLYQSERLSNNSAPSGFVWEEFDFNVCTGHEEGRYAWAVLTMMCTVLGLPASIAILWEMFKRYKRGTPFTPNDVFILNISAMDFVFLLFIPPGFLNHFCWRSWPFEATWNSTYALSTCGRPLLMACTCVDCYLAVVHPILYHKRKSLTPRVVIVGIVWTLTAATAVAFFLFYKLYFSVFSITPFIIAMIIIGICDSLILHKLFKSEPGKTNIHPQKQRAVQTLINSLVMTVFIYLPPVFILEIGRALCSNTDIFICSVVLPITTTASLGSAIMPILHLKNQGKLDCFRFGCCRRS